MKVSELHIEDREGGKYSLVATCTNGEHYLIRAEVNRMTDDKRDYFADPIMVATSRASSQPDIPPADLSLSASPAVQAYQDLVWKQYQKSRADRFLAFGR